MNFLNQLKIYCKIVSRLNPTRDKQLKASKVYNPKKEQPYEIKQSERQARRSISHSVGSSTRQTIDSAIKTPTDPKQSGAKSTKGPT